MSLCVFDRAPKRLTDDTESDTEDDNAAQLAVKPVVKNRLSSINYSNAQKTLASAPESSLPTVPVEQPCSTGNYVQQSSLQSSFEHSCSSSFLSDNPGTINNSALYVPLLSSSSAEHPPASNSFALNIASFPSDDPATSSRLVSVPSSDPCFTGVSPHADFATPTVLASNTRPVLARDSTPKCLSAVQSSTNGRSSGGIVRPLMTPRSTCDAKAPGANNLMALFRIDNF